MVTGASPQHGGGGRMGWARMSMRHHAKHPESFQRRRILRAADPDADFACWPVCLHPFCVAPSAIPSPISRFKPRGLSARGVERTIRDFVRSAVLAGKLGTMVWNHGFRRLSD